MDGVKENIIDLFETNTSEDQYKGRKESRKLKVKEKIKDVRNFFRVLKVNEAIKYKQETLDVVTIAMICSTLAS